MIVYKLCKIKNGILFPLYIYATEPMAMNKWLQAKPGIKKENGKVKSKLGDLAFRPGFHCTEYPYAGHIGKRQPDGSLYQAKDTVWCEVQVINHDYTSEVRKDVKNLRDACIKSVPYNGYYWYQTNPNAAVRWLIAGEIKILKILTQEEVNSICLQHGITPQPIDEL